MYLSYLDESGTPADKATRFFVLGGVMVFERQTHWLERELEAIADRYQQKTGRYLELHAGPMRNGKEGWELLSPAERAQATADVLRLLQVRQLKVLVFAAVVEKTQLLRTADILPYCYEVLATKVDDFLAFRYQRHHDPARGIFVLDRTHAQEEASMQALHRTFKSIGHASGRLRNFAEVPLFVDSKATRLLQLADTVCYWIYRRYESGDARGWELIAPHFAQLGNARTGLHEVLHPDTPARLATPQPQLYPFPEPLARTESQAPAPAVPNGDAPARIAANAIITP